MAEHKRASSKEFIFGGSMLLAAVFGYFVETNTDMIAKKKADQVAQCIQYMGARTVMNDVDVACVAVTTDPRKLPAGTTVDEMRAYVASQVAEAQHVELGRLAGWAFVGATEMVWPTIIYQAIT